VLEGFLFAMFAGTAIGCALGVVFHRNPVHCALLLVGVLLSISGLFVLLNAPFIAALQVVVYAGAIMVLFLFVVMLLNVKGETPLLTPGAAKGFGFLFSLLLTKPSPFYLLDEVEAALDDANIERFLDLLRAYQDKAQFIVVTHQRRTMEVADVLYGVTMAGDGESRVLSRRVPADGPHAVSA
jgi:uncharacterized MnhB-related membrane protein